MQIIEDVPAHLVGKSLWRFFGDPWLTMIAIGALGHQRHSAFLLSIGYWNVWLACAILQGLWPIGDSIKLRVREENANPRAARSGKPR